MAWPGWWFERIERIIHQRCREPNAITATETKWLALSGEAGPSKALLHLDGIDNARWNGSSLIGASVVRRFYSRHEFAIVRLSGVLFMGFAAQAIWHAVPGLLGLRKA